jgi:hypothetical protein
MWLLPLLPFALICTGMVIYGFRERAKYLAQHPNEDAGVVKKIY